MIIVFDYDGVAHAVYNQREVRETHERHRWVEYWQVRTLCCRDEQPPFFTGMSIRQADLDFTERGHAVTCLRCVTLPCDHGVYFPQHAARSLTAAQVRSNWPRLDGECKKGCGYIGIHYASREHYYAGDW